MDPQSREARQGVAEHLKTDPGPSPFRSAVLDRLEACRYTAAVG